MFGQSRWNTLDDIFNFHKEADRLFDQFWNDLPMRTASRTTIPVQVHADDESWRVDVPMPGIDPQDVTLEVTGNTLTIRADHTDGEKGKGDRLQFEQSVTVPQFLDLEKVSATHRHGMLRLTLPLKESVKPRRIAIERMGEEEPKQLTTA